MQVYDCITLRGSLLAPGPGERLFVSSEAMHLKSGSANISSSSNCAKGSGKGLNEGVANARQRVAMLRQGRGAYATRTRRRSRGHRPRPLAQAGLSNVEVVTEFYMALKN